MIVRGLWLIATTITLLGGASMNANPLPLTPKVEHAQHLLMNFSSLDRSEQADLKAALQVVENYSKTEGKESTGLREAHSRLRKSIRSLHRQAPILKRALLAVVESLPINRDDHLYLEEVEGEKALKWVDEKSNAARKDLSQHSRFESIKKKLLEISLNEERVAYPRWNDKGGLDNFWTDKQNVRGVWRTTSYDSYKSENPAWETVLDIDALNASEGKDWVYKGKGHLVDSNSYLIELSDGGLDAVEIREFDRSKKEFVKDGFYLPAGKHSVSWMDKDTVIVGLASHESKLTTSGYPRTLRVWKRGTDVNKTTPIFEGNKDDLSIGGGIIRNKDSEFILAYRSFDFYTTEHIALVDGREILLDVPKTADVSVVGNKYNNFEANTLLIRLIDDWEVGGVTYKSGSLLFGKLKDYQVDRDSLMLVKEPTATETISSYFMTKDYLVLEVSDNIKTVIYRYTVKKDGFDIVKAPFPENISGSVYDLKQESNVVFGNYESFLEPGTLVEYDVAENTVKKIANEPKFFDENKYQVEQIFATSIDGTKVPYFLIRPKGVEGPTPLLQYGYGGFRVSLDPYYMDTVEAAWLSAGNAYVIANIRGGGEYGPRWHEAALQENRHLAYQDFIAVSEDLIAKGYTTPDQLGIKGGSNGGLLTGSIFTMRPDLLNASIIAVPLLDMVRYHLLLAGASWMAEYGNPDKPEELAHLLRFSPYHNIDPFENYPVPYLTTSTKDDRVHPGHARKMGAALEDYGIPFYYVENRTGGHGSTDAEQRAFNSSLEWVYLYKQLAGEK